MIPIKDNYNVETISDFQTYMKMCSLSLVFFYYTFKGGGGTVGGRNFLIVGMRDNH